MHVGCRERTSYVAHSKLSILYAEGLDGDLVEQCWQIQQEGDLRDVLALIDDLATTNTTYYNE